jgi:hypothetical protein
VLVLLFCKKDYADTSYDGGDLHYMMNKEVHHETWNCWMMMIQMSIILALMIRVIRIWIWGMLMPHPVNAVPTRQT